jgi:hypothetical protein
MSSPCATARKSRRNFVSACICHTCMAPQRREVSAGIAGARTGTSGASGEHTGGRVRDHGGKPGPTVCGPAAAANLFADSESDRPARGSPSASARFSLHAQTGAERWFARCPVAGVRPLRSPPRGRRPCEGLGPVSRSGARWPVAQVADCDMPETSCEIDCADPGRLALRNRSFNFFRFCHVQSSAPLRGGQPQPMNALRRPTGNVERDAGVGGGKIN